MNEDHDWTEYVEPRATRTMAWAAPSTYGAIWPDYNGSDSEWYGE